MSIQMIKNAKRNALIAVGAAIISATALTGAAEAKPKNFHLHISGAGFDVGIGHRFGHRFGHRRYRSCRWLRRKARWTGSPYWYRRYRRCMRHNYW